MSVNTGKDSKLWRSAEEVLAAETVQIEGEIPSSINGTFLRVGPGKFDFDKDFSLNHWFDGYALISKFDISGKNGTVTFSSKYLESDSYRRAVKAQRPAVSEFGTRGFKEEGKTLFSKIISAFTVPELSDNANVAFFTLLHQEKLFVTGESCFFHEFNQSTLTGQEKFDTNKLFGLYICTAHPLLDQFGDTYNIGTSVKTGLRYNILKFPADSIGENQIKDQFKRSKIICSISSRWSTLFSYNHSFGLTKNYIIFIEQPFLINCASLLSATVQNKSETVKDWLEWHPEHPCRFYIVEKSTGKVINKSVEIVSREPFFFLHFINCYETEDNGHIIIDVSAYDNPEIVISAQEMNRLRGNNIGSFGLNEDDPNNQARCIRFTIPIGLDEDSSKAKRVEKTLFLTPDVIMEKGLELPTINSKFQGKNYQFYYASGLTTQGNFKNSICKVDVIKRKSVMWRESEHFIFGEPIFVPSTEHSDEDSGIIIVPMTDSRKEGRDMILFLDPKTMIELGRAIFRSSIPCSLHGIFIPNAIKP